MIRGSVSNAGDFVYSTSKISNKIAYPSVYNGKLSLFAYDLTLGTKTLICQSSNSIEYADFDNTDQYIYASHDSIVEKVNLSTLNSELIYKSCPNNSLGGNHISLHTNKVTWGWEKITALPPKYYDCYLHEHRCFEYDLNDPTRKLHEVKIYP